MIEITSQQKRFKGIDSLRRRTRLSHLEKAVVSIAVAGDDTSPAEGESFDDDHMRLIFTCCHPALPPDAQVALTWREVCSLTTGEIAN